MIKKTEGLKIFTRLYDLTIWLMQKTVKFPKNQRFVLAQRMDNIMIEMLENVVMANMSQNKSQRLLKVSEFLERLRILLRLSKDMKFINLGGYEYATKELDEIGRMLGGWIKQQRENRREGSNSKAPCDSRGLVEQQPEQRAVLQPVQGQS